MLFCLFVDALSPPVHITRILQLILLLAEVFIYIYLNCLVTEM